ncbi:twitching motility protein PilT [Dyadobacter beijingensis]|uniref:Twitching motility protein PilT n=1 Tax=Dyadobacter beijingensis TaxID=365489 RepID=A0ABQ2HHH9_9BACT|nr:type II toxin-antitoxin system VapC family toxin [Dyadobacter beijingensis]GGM79295.1 twitching motility protein PilT [Dyadobacter beijingensis]
MRVLLDTHTLIWFLENNPKLSPKAKSLIENLANDVFVHAVSWFEMAIKIKIGKLVLPDPVEVVFAKAAANRIDTIRITAAQLTAYNALPLFEEHRDPFDRLIIATAIQQELSILSDDPKFPLYTEAQVVW